MGDSDDEDCSSLTSSSGDTFHVFTDASVSISADPTKALQKNQNVLLGERKKLMTERQKLEQERKQLAEERKKLEEERLKLRLGDKLFNQLAKDKEDKAVERKIKKLAKDRKKMEHDEKMQRRLEKVEAKEFQKERQGLENLTDMDRSEHITSENFRQLRKTQKESEELRKINAELDKNSLHLDNISIDLVEESRKAEEERKHKEMEAKRLEEENRRKILEKARKKVQQERKQRQEMIRTRIAAEEAEAKQRRKEQEMKKQEKLDKAKAEANTDKARAERAYGWYTKLAMPKRDAMKKKITLIASIDISPDDVDLLPWNASGTMVNVAKLNAMYYTR